MVLYKILACCIIADKESNNPVTVHVVEPLKFDHVPDQEMSNFEIMLQSDYMYIIMYMYMLFNKYIPFSHASVL